MRWPPSGLLERVGRRTERVPLSAEGTVGGDGIRRRVLGAGVCAEPRRRPLPPQHVHVLEAHRAAGLAEHIRRARPREVHGAAPHHQYAAAGAGAAQRPHVCGGGARARGAVDRGGRARRARAAACRLRPRCRRARRRPRRAKCCWRSRGESSPITGATRRRRASSSGWANRKAAGKVEAGELAAWTTVASVILNLDETISKE